MDGVLVDTSASYHEAILQTTAQYADRLGLARPPVEGTWVGLLKRAGGFNNDWHLTSALLNGIAHRGAAFDCARYAAELTWAGGGPRAIERVLGPCDAAFDAEGPLKTLFQALYLGGLIDQETLLVTPESLDLGVPLAVATGRPAAEAEYALTHLGIRSRFAAVVTHDDAERAGMPGKPHPWLLLEAARRLGVEAGPGCVYVGDQPDDMRAARAAGFRAVGVTGGDPAAEAALVAAGAEAVAASATLLMAKIPS